jgi:hypothetical protein
MITGKTAVSLVARGGTTGWAVSPVHNVFDAPPPHAATWSAPGLGRVKTRHTPRVIFRRATIPVQAGFSGLLLPQQRTDPKHTRGSPPHARRKGRSLDPPPPSASSAGCDHCAKFRRAPDEGSDAAASPASPCAVPWWRAIRARRYAGGYGTIRVTLLAADPARNGDIHKSWRKTLCRA